MNKDTLQVEEPGGADINKQMVGEAAVGESAESAAKTQAKARLQEKLARVRDRLRGPAGFQMREETLPGRSLQPAVRRASEVSRVCGTTGPR
jgi:hypothetical protein